MIKNTVREQYQAKIRQLSDFKGIYRPKEGWIRVLRKALGMSSPQLAARLNISKSQASQMERMEVEDRITLKQLRRVAEALDCELKYALVPKESLEGIIEHQAEQKSTSLIMKTDSQMKLEDQGLSPEKLKQLINSEKDRLIREMPRDLWES